MSKFRNDMFNLVDDKLTSLRNDGRTDVLPELNEMLDSIITMFSHLYCTILISRDKIKRTELNDVGKMLMDNLNSTVNDFNAAIDNKENSQIWN